MLYITGIERRERGFHKLEDAKEAKDLLTFYGTKPRPAFGRQGLGGSSGGFTLGVVSMPCFAPPALSLALNQHTLSLLSQGFVTDAEPRWHVSKAVTDRRPWLTRWQKRYWFAAPNGLSAKLSLTWSSKWPVSKNVTDVELRTTAKTSLTWGPEWPVSKNVTDMELRMTCQQKLTDMGPRMTCQQKRHWRGAPNDLLNV